MKIGVEPTQICRKKDRPGTGVARRPASFWAEIKDRLKVIIQFTESVLRSPREAGVRIQYSGNAPPSGDLLHPAIAALEDCWRVNSVHLECVTNVVVGRRESRSNIPLIERTGIRIGAGVISVAQTILRIELEGVAEVMLQFQQ